MKFLILDIGAGTMDVLYYDSGSDAHYKAVARSPVLTVAERAAGIPGNLLITGREMGGGPITKVLRERAGRKEVIMSVSAAATIHHDPERVRALGIRVIEDREAEDLKDDKRYSHMDIGDLEIRRMGHIIKGMGVDHSLDIVGICAQDHGIPPAGMSHLDHRHNIFRAILEESPFPHSVLYRSDEVPGNMNRLKSIAETAKGLNAREIYVMDSGMAAILGGSLDAMARDKGKIMVLDMATSHTVAAAMEQGEIAGFFEYHTSDITLERLESLITDLADGKLEHGEVLKEGGHGAYIRKAFGLEALEIIIATGPKRFMIEDSRLQISLGAPLGDNMMTGTAGVLEAIARRKGIDELKRFLRKNH